MAKGNKKGGRKASSNDHAVHVSSKKTGKFQKIVILGIVAAFVVSTLLTGLAGMGAF